MKKRHILKIRVFLEFCKLYYFVLKMKKINRETRYVQKEYTSSWNEWKSKVQKANSINEFFIGGLPKKKKLFIKNKKPVFDKCNDSFYVREIEKSIKKNFPKARKIIEFGSGPGRNLLFLKKRNPHWSLSGLELTKSGVEVTRLASKKFKIPVTVKIENILKTSKARIGDVGYSSFALEQIDVPVKKAEETINTLLSKVRYGLVLLEPFREYYPSSLRGYFAKKFHDKVGYCSSFGLALEKLQAGNSIKVIKNSFKNSHNPLLFATLVTVIKN